MGRRRPWASSQVGWVTGSPPQLYGSRGSAELLPQAECIKEWPFLSHLAVSNAIDRDPSKRHGLPSRLDAHELASVGTPRSVTCDDLISFRDDVFHCAWKSGKAANRLATLLFAQAGSTISPLTAKFSPKNLSLASTSLPLNASSLNMRTRALFASVDIPTPPSHPTLLSVELDPVTGPQALLGHHLLDHLVRPRQHRGGRVRPRALAVFRLITSSNFVGCSIGNSPGLAPRRMRSTYTAMR